MAVLIQEISGTQHGKWVYPNVSGVARAHNFYPQNGARASDGIAMLALGLGGTVVDGGACVRITANNDSAPSYNKKLQSDFMALDVTLPFREQKSIVNLDLPIAQEHGTLLAVGGYIDDNGEMVHMPYQSPQQQMASDLRQQNATQPERLGGNDVHGMKREFSATPAPQLSESDLEFLSGDGKSKVVTMDGILQCEDLNLRGLLKELLKIGSLGFECPVEIEFAVNLSESADQPHEFVLLQTRPMSMWRKTVHHGFNTLPPPEASIIATKRALGNGEIDGIHDIVFIDTDNFDPSRAAELVPIISAINQQFKEKGVGYLLICPGRVGTHQADMGIPVQWSDISATRCIVETDIQGVDVPPSEGTHFFQNLVSFGIAYLTVYKSDEGHVDMAWLKQLLHPDERNSDGVVRTLHFEQPMQIVIDGTSSCGVVMKPDHDFNTIVAQQSAFMGLEDANSYNTSRL